MKAITCNIFMRKTGSPEYIIRAVINLEHIASVLEFDSGTRSSVAMSNGDHLIVEMPFQKLSEILLSHS